MIMPNIKKNIISVFVVLLLVITIVGVSYAYFTANLTGGESASTIIMNAGRLTITFSGNNELAVNNIYPRDDEWFTKNFALTGTNTTDMVMNYHLTMVVDNNTFSNNALSFSLTGIDVDSVGSVVNIQSQDIPAGTGTIELGNGSFNGADGSIHNYVLKIFFLNKNVNQIDDQNKSFAAHIEVDDGME